LTFVGNIGKNLLIFLGFGLGWLRGIRRGKYLKIDNHVHGSVNNEME
jgi:hypothetical protein